MFLFFFLVCLFVFFNHGALIIQRQWDSSTCVSAVATPATCWPKPNTWRLWISWRALWRKTRRTMVTTATWHSFRLTSQSWSSPKTGESNLIWLECTGYTSALAVHPTLHTSSNKKKKITYFWQILSNSEQWKSTGFDQGPQQINWNQAYKTTSNVQNHWLSRQHRAHLHTKVSLCCPLRTQCGIDLFTLFTMLQAGVFWWSRSVEHDGICRRGLNKCEEDL